MKHFIENISLIDYKIFKNFTAQSFEQVNLIGGCNNVGKTAFIEACYINLKGHNINSLISAIFSVEYMRQNINILTKCTEQGGLKNEDYVKLLEANSGFKIHSNIREVSYSLSKEEGTKEYFFTVDKDKKEISANVINVPVPKKTNIRFIDNFGLSDAELKSVYEGVQLLEKEQEVNRYVNLFDSQIESFKFIGDVPMCKLKDDAFYPLTSSFGDGLKSYIALICSIYSASEGQLFIDEVDNGIHYTHFKNIWHIIFDLTKEVNCQLFAITHSLEMIQAFNRVQIEKKKIDTSYFELAKDMKNNTIMMSKIDSEQLKYELVNDGKFRGE